MNLSWAVVLLLLVPFVYSRNSWTTSWSKFMLDNGRGNKRFDFIDDRLFMSTIAYLRVNQEGRIEERFLDRDLMARYAGNKANGLSQRNSVSSYCNFRVVLDIAEAWNGIRNLTDIIVYVSSHNKESYDPINFGYDESNLQLKSGPVLNNLYEHGAFYIAGIIFDHDKSNKAVYVSQPGTFTNIKRDEIYYDQYVSSWDWPKSDWPGHFWISSPGIYRYNLKTGKVNQLYYDPNRPGNLNSHLTGFKSIISSPMLFALSLLFTIAWAENRSVVVQGNVYCDAGGKRYIPAATVVLVKSDRGYSKPVRAVSVDKKGKFDFVATVDQKVWPGPATRVQIYLDCNEENNKHCMKRFPTGEKCEKRKECERFTEKAIAPTFYYAEGKESSARPYSMRNENLSDMQFYLNESVSCRASELIGV